MYAKEVIEMLTEKQEKFIQNVVKGMSQIDAYKDAYDAEGMSDNAISREASLLMRNPKIAQRHKELGQDALNRTIMTAQERLEFLTGIIRDMQREQGEVPADLNTKIRAIDIMNKMQGEYVQKIEADVNNEVTINIELSDE